MHFFNISIPFYIYYIITFEDSFRDNQIHTFYSFEVFWGIQLKPGIFQISHSFYMIGSLDLTQRTLLYR